MRTIDGSRGEGGGQILRTSLALSMLTGEPVQLLKIRAGRSKPGLLRQHLAAVRAAVTLTDARVEGDRLGSTSLFFEPRRWVRGPHHFAVGSAGSATLVLTTVLFPLLCADTGFGVTELHFEGGTHNRMAPPFPFLARTLTPLLRGMNADLALELERPGFYPAGGGLLSARIGRSGGGTARLGALALLERGPITGWEAVAVTAGLPPSVASRELATLGAELATTRHSLKSRHEEVENPVGPGNALFLHLTSRALCETFTGFGERGLRAEAVAEVCAAEANRYLAADVPVGEHLADQLLLPLALGDGGVFRTVAPSLHTRTQAELLTEWLGCEIRISEEDSDSVRIEVETR